MLMSRSGFALLCGLFCLPPLSIDAQLCRQWTQAVRIGELPKLLGEASGIAASRQFSDRLYHINDSGDSGRFYLTALNGSAPIVVRITDFKPLDTEGLGLGPCSAHLQRSCIYIADIGDNRLRRKTIEIVAVEEVRTFPAAAQATARLTLRYPDGPHDAEAMAVHPNGTLFILTKEKPARLYKARVDQTQATLEFVTTLETGPPPTDMAMSDDGTRLIVLTYQNAVEFSMDFKERHPIALLFLQQQETVTYLPGSRSFIYTTERAIAQLIQPIMRVDCAPTP
jgi:hypothetical protein